ncbi:MAG: hypothetical protein RL748_3964 [Pseudomonadota bacterium]|jgi:hypothetical protein
MSTKNTQARPLELDLLCAKLDADFGSLITGTGTSPESRQSNFYSKAIAAFVLCEQAGATLQEAAAASIDGGQDHGIDSVYIAADQTIWLIQSKYKAEGKGEPELGDVAKFRNGVADLLHGKWSRFNLMLQNQQVALTASLNDELCRIRVVLVHTGGAINDDRRDIFNDLQSDFCSTNPGFLEWVAYGLTTLHDLHLDSHATPKINAELVLQDFGQTQQPYKTFYGRMPAQKLSELWALHKDALVERNIRRFKGSTEVNQGLSSTLEKDAGHFFYFNNGVTFLCDAIREQHPRDSRRGQGKFFVEGLSIINGAQTVGVIGSNPPEYYDATRPADVMVTFICLMDTPDGFGDKVTKYRNRQNAVDLEDFAAIDERQLMWQKTLALAGVDYLLKHGVDDLPISDTCFSVREAAPFLACTLTTNDWQDYVIAAKSDQKRLFNRAGVLDAKKPLNNAYDVLFPDSLTAKTIWRIVQIGRFVQSRMHDRAKTEADPYNLPANRLPAREILRHGTWLLLHVLFVRIKPKGGSDFQLGSQEVQDLSQEVDSLAQCMVDVAQAEDWGKQARAVFSSKTDCQTMNNRMMAALARHK